MASFREARQRDVLTEGLVIAIEPIVSAGNGQVFGDADGWTIRTSDGALCAHVEHTVVVSTGEPLVIAA